MQVLSPPRPHRSPTLGDRTWRAQGRQARPALSTGLRLAEGSQVNPLPAPHGLLGLGISGATQQLCRDRVAWAAAACISFLSLYGAYLPSRCPSCRTLSVHDDDPLKIYSPPNHNLASIYFVSVNCWDETTASNVA